LSDRLLYEPLVEAHAAPLYPVLSPAEVWQHIWPSDATSVETLAARFRKMAAGPGDKRPGERWVNFAVRLRDGGAYCGRVEATVHADGEWAEIAYLFGPMFWGRGYATEAVGWLRAHLREQHGVRELWAATTPGNAPSRRLLERLGFAAVEAPSRALLSADPGDLIYCAKE
jgi:RimJ/RimL family protein N-acetyltransferase